MVTMLLYIGVNLLIRTNAKNRRFDMEEYLGKSKKVLFRIIFGRTLITIIFIIIQFLIFLFMLGWMKDYAAQMAGMMSIISFIVLVYIINKEESPEYKITWIILICILPILGLLLYAYVKTNIGYRKLKREICFIEESSKNILGIENLTNEDLSSVSSDVRGLFYYLQNTCGFPVYKNCNITYFPVGENKFVSMMEEIEKAKEFIFMEYFIIERGYMWNTILELLKKKAKEGIEVRVMYDGMCSIALLPYDYPKDLQSMNLKAKMFSPIHPLFSTEQNNRDHRKILIIDGKVAFNGGVNIADEYINQKDKFGHWKDNAVKIEGGAVNAFTRMFLQLWNAGLKEIESFEPYFREVNNEKEIDGYVLPYADGPTNDRDIAKRVYLELIDKARRYINIITPYFIVEQDFIETLCYAAERGVEVNILVPGIPDKKIPFMIAHTFFPRLLSSGVKIHKYTPGFTHAKMMVVDNEIAVIGTINLDYRSLYLHFECATLIYRNDVIGEM